MKLRYILLAIVFYSPIAWSAGLTFKEITGDSYPEGTKSIHHEMRRELSKNLKLPEDVSLDRVLDEGWQTKLKHLKEGNEHKFFSIYKDGVLCGDCNFKVQTYGDVKYLTEDERDLICAKDDPVIWRLAFNFKPDQMLETMKGVQDWLKAREPDAARLFVFVPKILSEAEKLLKANGFVAKNIQYDGIDLKGGLQGYEFELKP